MYQSPIYGNVYVYIFLTRGFCFWVGNSIACCAFIFYIIERLALIANTSSYATYTPIKVVDFCSPESSDDPNTAVYNGELATIRYGRIDIEKRPAIVRGFNMDYCTSEWEFKFSEVNLRA